VNIYTCFRKWVHYFRANDRHGTHSPFAYAFVEQVLNAGPPCNTIAINSIWKPTQSQTDFLQRLVAAYDLSTTISTFSGNPDHQAKAILLLRDSAFRVPNERDVILVPGIFDDPESYAAWKELRAKQEVPLSIETSVMGLLFFRKEFLVKQHFRLKRG
jgi:hypothetical protein